MQKILTIEQPKPDVLKKVKVGNDSRKKLLALIDLDETLVHCTGKINEEDIVFGFRRSSRYRQRAEVSFGN